MTPAETVTQTVASHFGLLASSITDATRLAEDLGADSLDLVQILMAIKEATGKDLSAQDTDDLLTVGDLVKAVEGVE